MIDTAMRRVAQVLFFILLAFGLFYVWKATKESAPHYHPRDYDEIAKEGVLRATMEYNAIDMHAEGDSIGGFFYEMINSFARDHGLQVSIKPEMSLEKRTEGINSGEFDVVAHGIPSTSDLKDTLLLTSPILLSKLILIQRKPLNAEDSLKYITSQIQLAGKTVHVTSGRSVITRMEHLSSEIGDTIFLAEETRYGNEQLISMVAHGDIDYAVCEEFIANLAADSLPQIDIHLPIGFTQFYCWGLNKKSPALLDSINLWLESYLKSREYRALRKKYF